MHSISPQTFVHCLAFEPAASVHHQLLKCTVLLADFNTNNGDTFCCPDASLIYMYSCFLPALQPLDGKDYALFRSTVRLDCGTPAGTPPPNDELQNRLRSLLNKYWNANETPNQCAGPCGFLEHSATFASIIRTLGSNVCARSRKCIKHSRCTA